MQSPVTWESLQALPALCHWQSHLRLVMEHWNCRCVPTRPWWYKIKDALHKALKAKVHNNKKRPFGHPKKLFDAAQSLNCMRLNVLRKSWTSQWSFRQGRSRTWHIEDEKTSLKCAWSRHLLGASPSLRGRGGCECQVLFFQPWERFIHARIRCTVDSGWP